MSSDLVDLMQLAIVDNPGATCAELAVAAGVKEGSATSGVSRGYLAMGGPWAHIYRSDTTPYRYTMDWTRPARTPAPPSGIKRTRKAKNPHDAAPAVPVAQLTFAVAHGHTDPLAVTLVDNYGATWFAKRQTAPRRPICRVCGFPAVAWFEANDGQPIMPGCDEHRPALTEVTP